MPPDSKSFLHLWIHLYIKRKNPFFASGLALSMYICIVPFSSHSLALKLTLKSHDMTTFFCSKWWIFHSIPFIEGKKLSFDTFLMTRDRENESERKKEPEILRFSLYYNDGGTTWQVGQRWGGTPPPLILVDQKTAAAAFGRSITTLHPRFSDLPPSVYYITIPTYVVHTF